ncbi:MAG: hypothetical protein ACI9WU_003782, partial [Myxococcota bacterium]
MRATALVLSLLVAGSASAEIKTFKYDQFPDSIFEAVNEMNGMILQNEPGFVNTEAYGALFRPGVNEYPVKLQGIDLVFGGAAGFPDLATDVVVELYYDSGFGAEPTNLVPTWTVSTDEVFDPSSGELGIDVTGNTAIQINFDYETQMGANAPPLLYEGNMHVMVRFDKPAGSFETQWGNLLCTKETLLGLCGCQPVSMILDTSLTPQTNILHIVDPPGSCSGNKNWFFFE